jgi:integrase
MGRKPTSNLNLPSRMRARVRNGTTYYTYDCGGKPRKEISLGTDYVLAVQKWAQHHEATPTEKPTVAWAIAKYKLSPQFDEVGLNTQADYGYALDKLTVAFGTAPLDEVRPSHVTLYLDKRGMESKHRALREKAVLSMVYTWAIARDFCTVNPVAAIKTKRLPGRKHVYITDELLESVYQKASTDMREAMDLAYYLGQRPGDVLKLSETEIRSAFFDFTQNKTGTGMRITATAKDLEDLLNRISARKAKFAVRCLQLLVDQDGKPMTKAKLRSRFEAAREAAGVDGAQFQFRDLRRKAGADLRDQNGIEAAQDLLGHKSITMTEHYTGGRGKKITAIPRKASNGAGS